MSRPPVLLILIGVQYLTTIPPTLVLIMLRFLLALTLAISATPILAQTVLVKPYVQPGDGGPLGKSDVKVIVWLTDAKPGEFIVEYEVPGVGVRTVKPTVTPLDFEKLPDVKKEPREILPLPMKVEVNSKKSDSEKKDDHDHPVEIPGKLPPEIEQHYIRYLAKLDGLPFDTTIVYRVKQGNTIIREASFRTRASADKPIHFALVGDMANGKDPQKAIAYRIAQEKPEFLVAMGDIVYPSGRIFQYMHFFWNTYNNVEKSDLKFGAPLMATVPFYPVIGNHDAAAKLATVPDALGAYYYFFPPKNGPGEGPWATVLGTNKARNAKFLSAALDSYPNFDNYSFDYGPAHFLMMNTNYSAGIDQPKFREWVEKDLRETKARWKFVCYHAPAFQSSTQHYTEQAMRLWQPVWEQLGVDVVFAGHVHNYQRTVPLKYALNSPKRDKKGRADGVFTLDKDFDGENNTTPKGVIHIVAGGGGASLYGPGLEKTSITLKKDHGDNYADYTAKMVADRHTFTVIDVSSEKFTLRAIDINGKEVDRFSITKPKQ